MPITNNASDATIRITSTTACGVVIHTDLVLEPGQYLTHYTTLTARNHYEVTEAQLNALRRVHTVSTDF